MLRNRLGDKKKVFKFHIWFTKRWFTRYKSLFINHLEQISMKEEEEGVPCAVSCVRFTLFHPVFSSLTEYLS